MNRENNAVVLDARNSVMDVPGGLIVNGTEVIDVIDHISPLHTSPIKIISPITDTQYTGPIDLDGIAYLLDVPLTENGEWLVRDGLSQAITRFNVRTWTSGALPDDNSQVSVFPITGSFVEDLKALYENSANLNPPLQGDLDLVETGVCTLKWVATADPHDINDLPGSGIGVRRLLTTGTDGPWGCAAGTPFTVRYGIAYTEDSQYCFPCVNRHSGASARYNTWPTSDGDGALLTHAVLERGSARVEFCGVLFNQECGSARFNVG